MHSLFTLYISEEKFCVTSNLRIAGAGLDLAEFQLILSFFN
jgi:hypothetical protein